MYTQYCTKKTFISRLYYHEQKFNLIDNVNYFSYTKIIYYYIINYIRVIEINKQIIKTVHNMT